jgi:hypothetical protein
MSKVEDYRQKLQTLDNWDDFLKQESHLPGPRANLELAFAVGIEGSEDQFLRLAQLNPEQAPSNTPQEFLAFCGVLGLGYLAARGSAEHFLILRQRASDPRWRIREAVALGLQQYGQASMENLLAMMKDWSQGTLLERRAAVATLCEPNLLMEQEHALKVLEIIEGITASILAEQDRKSEEFKVLRKSLAYGWSVVVAAQPSIGKPRMEKWIGSHDADMRWVMKQNLYKKRLSKMDESWVKAQLENLG